jgi:dephospho-CoA kinase
VLVLGLTGGMGAGKSTIARLFRLRHVPVFDADATVHRLQGRHGAAVAPIATLCPQAVADGRIRRDVLRTFATRSPDAMRALEAIMHPLVAQARAQFLRTARGRGAWLCVLDIPLLFEVGADRDCDLVVVAHAPLATRRRRIAVRRGVSMEAADALIARQMSDRARLARADIVIPTGLSRHVAAVQVARLLDRLYKLGP